eukprot:CAMPEP_0172922608 /NCGR_PEP_ID=MMETSP1075-20121228/208215_1 /TAXON_ID=2916 /ORGANISM="Ceratium fusus, Strain PA161109" /LENGTH=96 /DNA_ID=CAMNT_0013782951 /DNA_START=33 /DNA_END=320 /DNA_ORIENTATION=-
MTKILDFCNNGQMALMLPTAPLQPIILGTLLAVSAVRAMASLLPAVLHHTATVLRWSQCEDPGQPKPPGLCPAQAKNLGGELHFLFAKLWNKAKCG